MTTQTEALTLALEALEVAEHFLEEYAASKYYFAHIAAITAIKEALAQPEQEPYGYLKLNTGKFVNEVEGLNPMKDKRYLPLYTTPPQRIWVGLTDDEMFKTWLTVPAETEDRLAFGRAVEAKLKEKNT